MNTMWFSSIESPINAVFPTGTCPTAELPKNILLPSLIDDFIQVKQPPSNLTFKQPPSRSTGKKQYRSERTNQPSMRITSNAEKAPEMTNRTPSNKEVLYNPFCDRSNNNTTNFPRNPKDTLRDHIRPAPTRNRRLNISEQYLQIVNTPMKLDKSQGKPILNEPKEFLISMPPKFNTFLKKSDRGAKIYAIEHTSPTNLLKKNMAKKSSDSSNGSISTPMKSSTKPGLRRSKGVNHGLDALAKQEIKNPPPLPLENFQIPPGCNTKMNNLKYIYIEIQDDLSTLNIPEKNDERSSKEPTSALIELNRLRARSIPPRLAIHSQQLSPGRRKIGKRNSMNKLEEIIEEEEEEERERKREAEEEKEGEEFSEIMERNLIENSDKSDDHYYDIDLLVSYLEATDDDNDNDSDGDGHSDNNMNLYKRTANEAIAPENKSCSYNSLYRSDSSSSTISTSSSVSSINSAVSPSSSISSVSSAGLYSPNSLSSFLYGSYFDFEKRVNRNSGIDNRLTA
ncbi:hypothetical protein NADFUDRAFT_66668 [Nadsonia fulvescens var. elongata DSM 6958]|uniref:Uncharacterized protein n=1 Tax=Nadsonia fulvescens var. elongata DSM 6958 TaxID=857566 RepID=A0A1E3PGS4_9ASCO|nr:hypothetical protein NADFUDRAFT_66668 [Nadsonia fulvescens var. elongata DSM 6958]